MANRTQPPGDDEIVAGKVFYDQQGDALELRKAHAALARDPKAAAWFQEAAKSVSLGGWSLAEGALCHLTAAVAERAGKELVILECGGGQSTLFFAALSRLVPGLRVTTLEHNKDFAISLHKALRGTELSLSVHPLVQYTDEDWLTIFLSPSYADVSRALEKSLPQRVPLQEYKNTRIRNTFYDLTDFSYDRISPAIDLLILDGPNGNGRSLAFPLFVRYLRPGALVLIDDLSHYHFLHHLSLLFDFRIRAASSSLSKQWALLEITEARLKESAIPVLRAHDGDPRELFYAHCVQQAYAHTPDAAKTARPDWIPKKVHYTARRARDILDRFSPFVDAWRQRKQREKVYFRTIFYVELEIPYLIMNLQESWDFIDTFIVVEANVTHVGEERDFVFEKYRNRIPPELQEKLLYLPVDLRSVTTNAVAAKDGTVFHRNEAYIWDSFADHIDLRDTDIVIAADADEILYRHMYPYFLAALDYHDAVLLPLNQFFYRMNYLWQNLTVWAAQATRARYYKDKARPHLWRYEGERFPLITGCHFSWQLTIEQMIYKLQTYAHRDVYGHLADEAILRRAVENKEYPFEPDRPFSIRELDPASPVDRQYYPESFFSTIAFFRHLLP